MPYRRGGIMIHRRQDYTSIQSHCVGAAVVLLSCLLFLGARPVLARPGGITGYSGKLFGSCEFCHGGGVVPEVRFEGPAEVPRGGSVTLRFVVRSKSPEQPVAGFNVAASGGALDVLPDQGERRERGELTHTAPKPVVAHEAAWEFVWTAPGEAGMQTLYGAGLSSNNNGNTGGDGVAATTVDILVVEGPKLGDANCDGRVSAADLPALVAAWGQPGAESCSRADADCNGMVGRGDVDAVLTSLFASPVPPAC